MYFIMKYNHFKYIIFNFFFGFIIICSLLLLYTKGWIGENDTSIISFLPGLLFTLFIMDFSIEGDVLLFVTCIKNKSYLIEREVNFNKELALRILVPFVVLSIFIIYHLLTNTVFNGIVTGLILSFSILIMVSTISLRLSFIKKDVEGTDL